MSHPITRITFDDSTLPVDATTTIMFESSTAFPGKRQFLYAGLNRLTWDVAHDKAAKIELSKSDDRGVTYEIVETLTLPAAAPTASRGSFLIEQYDDFKVVWINGGTTQTKWDVSMSLVDERAS